jgi:hypothetical protein
MVCKNENTIHTNVIKKYVFLSLFLHLFLLSLGLAMVQMVSRRPVAAEVRFVFQAKLCGICGEQSGNGKCKTRPGNVGGISNFHNISTTQRNLFLTPGCCVTDLESHSVYESEWPLGMYVEEWLQEIRTSGY